MQLTKKTQKALTDLRNKQKKEHADIERNMKQNEPQKYAVLEQHKNEIKNLKQKRSQLKNINSNLLMDKMEYSPESVIKLDKPLYKKLLVNGISKSCICEEYIDFEEDRFFLYISKDSINTEFLIEKGGATIYPDNTLKDITLKD